MKTKTAACFLLIVTLVFASGFLSHAQDWELIGQVKLAEKRNNVDIAVSNTESLYRELRFGVQSFPVELKRIEVLTTDGNTINIVVQDYIRPGEYSPPVTLSENGLAIENVKLIYYAKKWVTIELYGKTTVQDKKPEAKE